MVAAYAVPRCASGCSRARDRRQDVALCKFLEAVDEHGLAADLLVSEPGTRVQDGDVVLMTTDMSVFELKSCV